MAGKQEAPPKRRGFFLGGGPPGVELGVFPETYCWGAAAGLELAESCSRSFFNRLISTRPPLVRLAVFSSSVLTGASPIASTYTRYMGTSWFSTRYRTTDSAIFCEAAIAACPRPEEKPCTSMMYP